MDTFRIFELCGDRVITSPPAKTKETSIRGRFPILQTKFFNYAKLILT